MNIAEIRAAVQAHVDCGTDQETREARDHLVASLAEMHRVVPDWRLLVLHLIAESERLGVALLDCADSLECSILQQYQGVQPESMHPVTYRQYCHDMHDVHVARDTVFDLSSCVKTGAA